MFRANDIPETSPIIQELVAARLALELWLGMQAKGGDEFPYLPFDRMCQTCMYVCKEQWRFHGLRGASGKLYTVGPLCPVLWQFSPLNQFVTIQQEKHERIYSCGNAHH